MMTCTPKILLILTVCGFALANIQSGIAAENSPADWWETAIFYEIFVRSFYDSDCDGIGDFNGITQKLDYLQDLGVTALWLMPIHPSPSYHGYDVVNYYAVNHEYGSMADFKNLLAEAHRRDMHVIIDLVLNHTSNQHPFFVAANSSPTADYREWYVWSDEDPGNGWYPGNLGFYYAYFWSGMPDLNYENPAVTAQMMKVVEYWLEQVGVDGFRVDAAKHLIEDGDRRENTPATHAWYRDFYTAYKAGHAQAYTIGEVYGAGAFIATTYQEEFDHLFNFELASGFIHSANGGSNTGVNSAYKFTLADMPTGGYATFLTNHDQNRVMSMMYGNVDKARVAASLMLTAPGTPYIYYGEEIGMQGMKPDEDTRLPMQWSEAPNAGFSCEDAELWRAAAEDYAQVNVLNQHEDEDSLLNHYRALIALRKQYPALTTGLTTLIETDDTALFGLLRSSDDEHVLILINLTEDPLPDRLISATGSPLPAGRYVFEGLYGDLDGSFSVDVDGAFSTHLNITIQPFQTLILTLRSR